MRFTPILLAASLIVLAGCSDMFTPKPRESELSERTTATVLEVDEAAGKVRIEDENGARFTVVAGSEAHDISKLQAGDQIAIDYYRSVMAQVAEPGGSDDPIVAVDGGRNEAGGFGLVATNLVVRLVSYEPKTARATIELPSGEQSVVTVPTELRKFVAARSPGERIEVTVVEAAAISIEEL